MPAPTTTGPFAARDELITLLSGRVDAHASMGLDYFPVLKGWRDRYDVSDARAVTERGQVVVHVGRPSVQRCAPHPLRDGTGADGDPVDDDEVVNITGTWEASVQVDVICYRGDILFPVVEVVRPWLRSTVAATEDAVVGIDAGTLTLRLDGYAWTRATFDFDDEGLVDEEGAHDDGQRRYRFTGTVRGDQVEVTSTNVFEVDEIVTILDGGPDSMPLSTTEDGDLTWHPCEGFPVKGCPNPGETVAAYEVRTGWTNPDGVAKVLVWHPYVIPSDPPHPCAYGAWVDASVWAAHYALYGDGAPTGWIAPCS